MRSPLLATSVIMICVRSAARKRMSLITPGHASASTQMCMVVCSSDWCFGNIHETRRNEMNARAALYSAIDEEITLDRGNSAEHGKAEDPGGGSRRPGLKGADGRQAVGSD